MENSENERRKGNKYGGEMRKTERKGEG